MRCGNGGLWQADCCHNPLLGNAGSGRIATAPISATGEKNLEPQNPSRQGHLDSERPRGFRREVPRSALLEGTPGASWLAGRGPYWTWATIATLVEVV